MAIFSGHDDWVRALAFSSDGVLLVSGGDDTTVKLWDIQTGGVIKTFSGHTSSVSSVSISPDQTTLASGSKDNTIRLWGVWTGECFCTIDGHSDSIKSVCFFPTYPKHLISASKDQTVRQWDINGCQIGPTYEGNGVAFSLDGAQFVSWRKQVATVRNSESGAIIAQLQFSSGKFRCCCFSPSGTLMAGCVHNTIYVWDITCSDPHLLKTFTNPANNLAFSTSLISIFYSGSVMFWQIGRSSTGPITTNTLSTPPTSTPIKSVSLQAGMGIAISSDSAGVVKTWDMLTGICKATFQTPAQGDWRDTQLIDGRVILVWHNEEKIHVWDTEKDEPIQTVDAPEISGLQISGDGSKVFCLVENFVQSWSMWTGEALGEVELKAAGWLLDPFCADGSKIWVQCRGRLIEGWDFGILGTSPIPLPSVFPNRPYLSFIFVPDWEGNRSSWVKDVATGNIFQLVGGYSKPHIARWDGRYLVAGYKSGEILILDFKHIVPQ